jgi:methionyl-tRNA formyltransferase
MRIVFVGTAAFGVPSLRALVRAGHDVPLVVTQPDRPGHRLRVTPPPVKVAAGELHLRVAQPGRIGGEEALAALQAAKPELMVVVAYGQILPGDVLRLPPRGVLNVHASLLPRHRGAAPVARAVLAGDRVTGVTIMQMDEELDHGPILSVRETEIGPYEDAASLTDRLAELGADLLVETLGRLGDVRPAPQDHSRATLAPKLRKQEGELDWSLSSEEIDRRVRALASVPGTWLALPQGQVKVLSGHPVGDADRGLKVETRDGVYVVDEVQPPGGRRMPAEAWLRGRR